MRRGVICHLIWAVGATRTAVLIGELAELFIRWRDKGIWDLSAQAGKLLEIVIDEPDYKWLMLDASHCKVHPHAAGAVGGNQDMSRTKGGSTQSCIWPWTRRAGRSGL